MNQWRMAFRVGADGTELWPQCKTLGIAAITYKPLAETDLSQFAQGEPAEDWKKLESSQKFSLKSLAYEMKANDIIYMKQGPMIIWRGRVAGSYQFDADYRIIDEFGTSWPHQVPVQWERNFLSAKMKLGAEMSTIERLTEDNIVDLEKVFGSPK